MKPTITVIGGGLAGCEAAWQAAKQGARVRLVEMKPNKYTPAHHAEGFAELVCSNSLRSDSLANGVGLLKEEMRRMGSLIMEAADATRVPAGSALAVDRDLFSAYITEKIKNHPEIEVVSEEVERVEGDGERATHYTWEELAVPREAWEIFEQGTVNSDAIAELAAMDAENSDKIGRAHV